MSDYLLEIAKNPYAKQAIRTLGLPIPLPPTLRRADGADVPKSLTGQQVVIGGEGLLADVVGAAATAAGAEVLTESERAHALVFDASDLRCTADLAKLHAFFHSKIRQVSTHGRVVILGRPANKERDPIVAATQRALVGFTKSLGKETGRKAITANLLTIAEGAEDRAAGALRFLLGQRSAFVSGQALNVSLTAKGEATDLNHQPLAGKVALITGAARGIGAAIATRLGQEGATLILVDRPEGQEGMGALLDAFEGTSLALDLTDADAAERISAHISETTGGVDILINNAGVTRDRTIAKMSADWWNLCLGVNLEAAIGLTETLRPKLLRKNGRIVHISSIGGIAGNPGQTNYGASKAGLIGYAEALVGKVSRRGVTVNCVAPGFIETAMTAAMPAVPREAGRRLNALSQGGQAQDIADAVAFLASPGAHGITGHTLRVCGLHLAGA
ncbi:MAG: 3-oxoacyl-ACP reductase [Myxococcales bacterium]|nr:3-oxoacyl-ACP reductase [Myxococcales bacterium]